MSRLRSRTSRPDSARRRVFLVWMRLILVGEMFSADIFCAPATGGESFGIVLLEAMACGKPVIASNIEGYATVLNHNEEGLLVPPGNEEALAEAILSLSENRSLREQMGAKGNVKAKEYSWKNVARQITDYYTSLLR